MQISSLVGYRKERGSEMFETDPIVKAIFDALNKREECAFQKWQALWRASRIAKAYMDRTGEGECFITEPTLPSSTQT